MCWTKTFEQPYGTSILVGSDGIYLPYLKNVGMDLPMHYHVFKICRNEVYYFPFSCILYFFL